MKAHSFFPGQAASTTYAMAGDDLSLFFDLEALTPKQQADHDSNVVLTGLLHGALIGIGKREDHIALFEAAGEEPWKSMLEFYFHVFKEMGLDPIPPDHWHYHPPFSYYDSIASGPISTDSVTLYMLSGSNGVIHNNRAAFEISQKVNSKAHFAENAPGYGIPVPETLLTTKAGLEGAEVADFLSSHPGEIMLKILGLAGARNVTSISDLDEARAYVGEYVSDSDVILQQKLLINDSMFSVYSSRPPTGQFVLEWLRLANALEWSTLTFFNQFIYISKKLYVNFNPILIVFPSFR